MLTDFPTTIMQKIKNRFKENSVMRPRFGNDFDFSVAQFHGYDTETKLKKLKRRNRKLEKLTKGDLDYSL